ncbi:MAG: DNA mismatch repair protein MutS [Nannocystaceae bacterium]|nr:DNA mismatch repair protein MutS [Nannocystaceae bacterium]
MSEPRREYEARLKARTQALETLRLRVRTISNLRLAVFTAGLGTVVLAWSASLSWWWLAGPCVAFIGLVVAHERATDRAAQAARAVAHYEAGLHRLGGTWAGRGVVRADLAPPDHPYAADLDLFGEGSLFDRLCLARTGAGIRMLADWLLQPAEPVALRARQHAVDELRDALDLRESLALTGEELRSEIDPSFLAAWAARPPAVAALSRAHALAWTMMTVNVAAAAAWASGATGFPPLAVTLAVTWFASRPYARFMREVMLGVERPGRELAVLAAVVRQLEAQSFTAPRLQHLRAELSTPPSGAAASIARLVRNVAWLDAQRNSLFVPIAFPLMWGLHFGLAVERWRLQHGPQIESWLGALGELEALSSISAYAYERPEDPFPEFANGEPLLHGEGVGHPLLAEAECIRNDIELSSQQRALLVSGSNMSGKSTYLRTIGVAVVLAQTGAPVCARKLRLTPLRVGATLRVQDSIQTGTSRFFAELKRLRAVMDLTDQGPGCLFLLDEILHGTNSHDRKLGAHAILASLLDRRAIGLVTTHDLALTGTSMPSDVANVHFADQVTDGQLHFNYRVQPGVVQTSNALALMRAIGLDV